MTQRNSLARLAYLTHLSPELTKPYATYSDAFVYNNSTGTMAHYFLNNLESPIASTDPDKSNQNDDQASTESPASSVPTQGLPPCLSGTPRLTTAATGSSHLTSPPNYRPSGQSTWAQYPNHPNRPPTSPTSPQIPTDEPFAVNASYIKDTHPKKVNLGIGVYRTNKGDPWPLRVVEDAEKAIYNANDISRHEYLSIQGDREFLRLAADLVFDFNSAQTCADTLQSSLGRVTSIQTVSGTGANRLGAEFLTRNISPGTVWIPAPTWANHHTIWDLAGVPRKEYPYYNQTTGAFNYEETLQTLRTHSVKNDVLVLHACAHNPTGADPSREQWEGILDVCKEKGLIPFFDLAYQGFASGDVGKDGWAIRRFFEERAIEFVVAQSFSKNFGLYGQRVGALHVVSSSSAAQGVSDDILATLCHLVRGEYSMAPRGGAEIVRRVLGNKELRARWVEDLDTMSTRILSMRKALFEELVALGTPGDWGHVVNQIGMFTYVGLSESQVFAIRERYHVYMLKSGRISISGLNESNVRYVAMAIDDVVRSVS
ncbi:pyridoxal phosphate-dependent transferase [Penicillium waksmanii]|uniref:pyridoxal phosphate-dependent transferase n=1 Tax=Penicillium waksmanii TaxID=69791 RepID=UPI0025499572|nr:pyridoxal phosphate-dependent transferase [Penicillium waksmanii]KAJ5984616.1 pyridoxal phosphate-dependent transferase [Penicillium waksmanii]